MNRNHIIICLWICLYIGFVIEALCIHNHVQQIGMTEVWGWDYHTFVTQIQSWRYVTYFGFRHPGLGVVLSPLVAIEHIWSGAYLLFMPGVAFATAYLICKMSGLIGLAVWLSFPVTWLMAAIPESFPVAQLVLVGSLYLMNDTVAMKDGVKSTAGIKSVMLLGILNGMVTLTNGLKPILAYLITSNNRRSVMKVGLAMIIIALCGAVFFYVRSLFCERSYLSGIAMTLSWIPDERNFMEELYGFFIKPVGLLQSLIIYPLCIYSLCRFKSSDSVVLLQMLVSFASVDVLLHLVVGWGMSEPWVFAPHWLFILPILIGRRFHPRYMGK